MYFKSDTSINLHTGVFDWNNMTSQTSIKIDDGTGIILQTPDAITSNSVINLKSNTKENQSFNVNVNAVLYAGGLYSTGNISCSESVILQKI
jgi:hypothetical protein